MPSHNQRRSLERRVRNARLGRFKTMADFDWEWPDAIDRDHVEDVLRLDFLTEAANVVIVGPNGVGKTTIARNLGYQALLAGHAVLSTTASEMLNDLAAQDSSTGLSRRLRRYCNPAVLIVDEIGSLATLAADLTGYDGTKSSLHFYAARPLPAALVRKLIQARRSET